MSYGSWKDLNPLARPPRSILEPKSVGEYLAMTPEQKLQWHRDQEARDAAYYQRQAELENRRDDEEGDTYA
jgi:hypothetical protein